MARNDPPFGGNPLSQEYVYYESLSYDGDPVHKRLYNQVKNSLGVLGNSNTQIETSTTLFKMAQVERQKEIAFLTNVFGFKVNADLNDRNSGKVIIEAFNSTLNLKRIYDRNINKIKMEDGEEQVDITATFGTNLTAQFNKYIGLALVNAKRQFDSGNVDFLVALEKQVDKALSNAIDGALEATLGKRSAADKKNNTENAYSELLAYINKNMGAKNWLKTQIYHNYKLDQVKQELMSKVKSEMNQQNRKEVYTSVKSQIVNNTDSNRQGGFTREYLTSAVAQMILSGFRKNNKIRVTGTVNHTGNIGQMKADHILTFNIPIGIVNKAFSQATGGGTREKNVNIIRELGKKLSNIDDGYIVYTSSKNYTINNNFKRRGGFSSGKDITLGTFKSLLQDSPFANHAYNMVGGIMQLLKGAVGNGRKDEYVTAIARYVAYFLFDDIGSIGTNIKGSSPTALHLFDLNGIYIPLSFFLDLLAKSFASIQKTQPTNLVRVNIIGAERGVKYPYPQKYTPEMWTDQGEDALNNIKISLNFLADFQKIITNL